MKTTPDFDGVFRFTNPTDEDFTVLWDNKEYTYKAQTTSPMIIRGETLENIQEIRKRFAYKLALREFYKSETYMTMKGQGNGLPPTFDEKILEPLIEQCLVALPLAYAEVSDMPVEDERKYTSKAMVEGEDPNFAFKDAPVKVLGRMPDSK